MVIPAQWRELLAPCQQLPPTARRELPQVLAANRVGPNEPEPSGCSRWRSVPGVWLQNLPPARRCGAPAAATTSQCPDRKSGRREMSPATPADCAPAVSAATRAGVPRCDKPPRCDNAAGLEQPRGSRGESSPPQAAGQSRRAAHFVAERASPARVRKRFAGKTACRRRKAQPFLSQGGGDSNVIPARSRSVHQWLSRIRGRSLAGNTSAPAATFFPRLFSSCTTYGHV